MVLTNVDSLKMDFHGFLWIFMDFYGFKDGFLWIFIDFHGFSWIFMAFYGFSWIFMDLKMDFNRC
jgi:hypothetical protein